MKESSTPSAMSHVTTITIEIARLSQETVHSCGDWDHHSLIGYTR